MQGQLWDASLQGILVGHYDLDKKCRWTLMKAISRPQLMSQWSKCEQTHEGLTIYEIDGAE